MGRSSSRKITLLTQDGRDRAWMFRGHTQYFLLPKMWPYRGHCIWPYRGLLLAVSWPYRLIVIESVSWPYRNHT